MAPRSTCTPNRRRTPRSSCSPATRTGPRAWPPASTAGSTRRRLVNANRGLLGYTGTVDGVPVSVQTTMMGTPTTSIVVEELHQPRRDDVHPRRDVRRVSRARPSVTWSSRSRPPPSGGIGPILGGGESTAPTADIDVVHALARREPRRRPHHARRAGRDLRRLLRPASRSAPAAGALAATSPAEMETAAVYLLAMRERGKGRPVRAGTILTVSDVILDPDVIAATRTASADGWERLPEDELQRADRPHHRRGADGGRALGAPEAGAPALRRRATGRARSRSPGPRCPRSRPTGG